MIDKWLLAEECRWCRLYTSGPLRGQINSHRFRSHPVDICCFVDKNVCEAVQDFAIGIGGFKNWSVEKHGYLFLKTHNGAQMPIKRVRIAWEGKNALAIDATKDPRQSKLDNQRHTDSSAKHQSLFLSPECPLDARRSHPGGW